MEEDCRILSRKDEKFSSVMLLQEAQGPKIAFWAQNMSLGK